MRVPGEGHEGGRIRSRDRRKKPSFRRCAGAPPSTSWFRVPKVTPGTVYCVWDRSLQWRGRKCRPCVVLATDGAGGVRVVPRTTHPRDPNTAIASALSAPPFDKAGWFVPVSIPILEADLLDHRGACPSAELATIRTAVL
jgi:hypothetical protein